MAEHQPDIIKLSNGVDSVWVNHIWNMSTSNFVKYTNGVFNKSSIADPSIMIKSSRETILFSKELNETVVDRIEPHETVYVNNVVCFLCQIYNVHYNAL